MWARRSIFLAAALAALLLVIGVSVTAVWWNARTAQDGIAELHDSHMRANQALASIRADIYLTGILTRDYLLESETATENLYSGQFRSIQEDTERYFRILEQSPQDEEQRTATTRLRHEIQIQYWDPTVEMLAWSPEQKKINRQMLLERLVKRRQEVTSLAGEVEKLITTNFLREQQKATTADQEFRASFGWTILIALLLGFGISGVTLIHMTRLERQSQAAESELRRLAVQIRMTQEEERKNLSRELHDQVGQLLTGLRMELGGIARSNGDDLETVRRVEAAKLTVEHLIASIRNIAMFLRPSMLDDLGLTAALSWLVKEYSRTSGIEVHAQVDAAADRLPEAHRTCIYRVVQEALTNAARHSGARKVDVVLDTLGDWVTVSITDDGRGFDTSQERERGLGLVGIEERVKELGGTAAVVSAPGRGTRVEIRLPRPVTPEVVDVTSSHRGRSRDRSDRLEASA